MITANRTPAMIISDYVSTIHEAENKSKKEYMESFMEEVAKGEKGTNNILKIAKYIHKQEESGRVFEELFPQTQYKIVKQAETMYINYHTVKKIVED